MNPIVYNFHHDQAWAGYVNELKQSGVNAIHDAYQQKKQEHKDEVINLKALHKTKALAESSLEGRQESKVGQYLETVRKVADFIGTWMMVIALFFVEKLRNEYKAQDNLINSISEQTNLISVTEKKIVKLNEEKNALDEIYKDAMGTHKKEEVPPPPPYEEATASVSPVIHRKSSFEDKLYGLFGGKPGFDQLPNFNYSEDLSFFKEEAPLLIAKMMTAPIMKAVDEKGFEVILIRGRYPNDGSRQISVFDAPTGFSGTLEDLENPPAVQIVYRYERNMFLSDDSLIVDGDGPLVGACIDHNQSNNKYSLLKVLIQEKRLGLFEVS